MIHFWCDTQVGLGHLVRCLAIAQWAEVDGLGVSFVVTELSAELQRFLVGVPFEVVAGDFDDIDAQPSDFVVADGYDFDLAPLADLEATTVVIDDLGERDPAVDVVVNPNVYAPRLSYPSASCVLLGAQYALLRPEFAAARLKRAPTRASIERVFVMLGGHDTTGEIPAVLDALQAAQFNGHVDIVTGRDDFEPGARTLDITVHRSIASPAALMQEADLAFAAAGGSTWELACVGVPAIQVVVADNQREIGSWLSEHRIGIVMVTPSDPTALARAFAEMSPRDVRQKHTDAARRLVDGHGARRVVEALRGDVAQRREAPSEDSRDA